MRRRVRVLRSIELKNRVALLPYAAATGLAFVSPFITLGICAAVATFYALPQTTAS